MGQLKILAGGGSKQAQAQARGKLFEKLVAEVLRHYGYSIDLIPNINYAGMEIDIEGKHIATSVPLYAECKCYETDVDSPKLQAFFGKYMTRWRRDKRCHGLFVALPGINSHAKGFYRENIEGDSELTFPIFEEKEVLEAIRNSVASPEVISKSIPTEVGKPGDWLLLYTDKGLFWLQYVIPPGEGIPNSVIIFDTAGNPLSDGATSEYLKQLLPELEDFTLITFDNVVLTPISNVSQDRDEVVEVQGSSAPFEYQFPASPEHFVGRYDVLEEIDSFVEDIINKKTSSRSILFEANSGWGKSSVVLATVDRIQQKGHFAVAIDSRSAFSSQFVLRVVDHVLQKFGDLNGMLPEDYAPKAITGFEGAVDSLVKIGQLLEQNHKVMFIFLDQFENLFFLQDVLKRIRDLFLKIQDANTNVVLGFSWKTDLVSLTSEFPYQTRDTIANSSKHIILDTFSKGETDALLDKLSEEIRAPLRKDLRFLLSEFSQGYPWLLKKLCAHVKFQRDQNIPQKDIASSLLNIEELFQEDLNVLSVEEEDALRRIAKAAPISIQEIGEEFSLELVKSLVHRRLVVRIGSKYDIYWDIFRDYLNIGHLPIQDNYILHTQVGSVLHATKLLANANGRLSISEFTEHVGLSKKSVYNILRDMRLIGLVKIDKENVSLLSNLSDESEAFEDALQGHLKERLQRNRLIMGLLIALREKSELTMDEVSRLLEESCPYISATKKTWETYARKFAMWMDSADLAIFDDTLTGTLFQYTPGVGIRDRQHPVARRQRGIIIPSIQYSPIEEVLIRLIDARQKDEQVDRSNIRPGTFSHALSMLVYLGFIERKADYIIPTPKAHEFVSNPDKRPLLFAESAKKLEIFKTFVEILEAHKDIKLTLYELGTKLRERLGVNWKDGAAKSGARIMLNWARRTKLAPEIYVSTRSKPVNGMIIPSIQYSAIEKVLIRLVVARQKNEQVDRSDIRPRTFTKALSMLVYLGFIERNANYIYPTPKAYEFVSHHEKRSLLFAEGALKTRSFKTFVEILEAHKDAGLNLPELSTELRKRLGANWKDSTAKADAKIMLNWARHTKLAPEVFYNIPRKSIGDRE